jgi:hypothetical protein
MPSAPGPNDYLNEVIKARASWADIETLTVQEVEQAYAVAIQALSDDLKTRRGPVTRAVYTEIINDLELHRAIISDRSFAAIRNGVVLAHSTCTDTAGPHSDFIDIYVRGGQSDAVKNIDDTTAAAYYARTSPDGLILSSRVWGSTERFSKTMAQTVESALINGTSAVDLARQLDKLVKSVDGEPVALTPLSASVREGLGWKHAGALNYETTRIARSEINTAAHESTVLAGRASPFYLGVQWVRARWFSALPAGHHGPGTPYYCEVCTRLAAAEGPGTAPVPDAPAHSSARYYERGNPAPHRARAPCASYTCRKILGHV